MRFKLHTDIHIQRFKCRVSESNIPKEKHKQLMQI